MAVEEKMRNKANMRDFVMFVYELYWHHTTHHDGTPTGHSAHKYMNIHDKCRHTRARVCIRHKYIRAHSTHIARELRATRNKDHM
jgi:hypothetical protein